MLINGQFALGWTPILAVASNGTNRVLQIVGWTGGNGTAPVTGNYLGSTGIVTNITDGQNIGANAAGGGIALYDGIASISSGTAQFSNSNGVTFGFNGQTITASVFNNYQSTGNYLTTAMQSNAGSNFMGTNTALTANGVSMTANSSGLSLNFPAFLTTAQPVGAYLTTAALSNHSHNFATTTTNGALIVVGTTNSDGATIGVPSFLTTAQPVGAYLTTARASNDAIGLNSALTANGVSVTANSSGLSLNFPAFLTTAMQSGASTQFVQANAAFAGTNASGTIASNGISISVNPGAGGGAAIKGSGTYTQNTGTVEFANSNGITFGLSNNGTMTASHNGLTTARASNDAVGLNTAQTNVTWTVNSSGISINAGAYLTTAMQSNAATISNIKVSAGTLSANRSDISFNNGNGVSFGLETNGVITASVAAAGGAQTGVSGISAGTTQMTSGTLSIANSNGISFGMNGNTLTATVVTNYQSQGAYLTTAALSGDTTKYVQNWKLTGNTAGTTSSAQGTDLWLAGGNGVTVSGSNNSISFSVATNYQSQGAYLTTARASNDAVGLNTALTANGVSWTVNSSGISLNVPAFLTTAALSNHSHNFATTTTNGAVIVVATTNSAGATIAVPSFLTTAMASNAATISNINVSGGTTSSNLSAINFVNSNGVSWSLDTASKVYATVATNYQSQGAYLTTAMQTGSQSQLWIMGNSSATVGGTNISGTMFSNGLSLSVAAPGGGGGIAASLSGNSTSGGAGYSNITSGTMILAGGPNITLSQDGSRISISANAPGAAAENNWNNLLGANTAGNTTASGSTIGLSGINMTLSGTNGSQIVMSVPGTSSISGTGQVSISVNGSTISIGVPATTFNSSVFGKVNHWAQSSSSLGQNSLYFFPELIHDYITGSVIKIPVMATFSSSGGAGAFTRGHTASFAVYTRQTGTNSSALTRLYSTSYTLAGVFSSNANCSISVITAVQNSTSYNSVAANSAGLNLSLSVHGNREFIMPFATLLNPGEYWFAYAQSSSSAGGVGNVFNISHIIGSSQTQNRFGVSTAASLDGIQKNMGLGTYSATSAQWPAAVTLTQIQGGATWPIVYLFNDTV